LTPFKNRFGFSHPLLVTFDNGEFKLRGEETHLETYQRLLRENPGILSGDLLKLAQRHGVPLHRAEALLPEGMMSGWLHVVPGPGNRKYCYFVAPGQQPPESLVC
jgi:hypothetical protein